MVAPDRDRSGASNSLTLSRPLSLTALDSGFYCVDGTPADCVYLGVNGVWDEKPDLVISGINHGGNLGDDVLYSGTVAAAMEGRNLGMPAIAMSLTGTRHFDTAGRVAASLVGAADQLSLPPRSLLNVNVPDLPWTKSRAFASPGWATAGPPSAPWRCVTRAAGAATGLRRWVSTPMMGRIPTSPPSRRAMYRSRRCRPI